MCGGGSRRGIIPALAGNTYGKPRTPSAAGDHPRACGEHKGYKFRRSKGMGSSPRLRGTRDRSTGRHSHGGIIPALAGNTDYTLLFIAAFWDHPRACGEHWWLCFHALIILGSSPRLRGTLLAVTKLEWNCGIIPALAGNTISLLYHTYLRMDHPRACGEHNRPIPPWYGAQGSSPRLRGTRRPGEVVSLLLGIIPALAGNTR